MAFLTPDMGLLASLNALGQGGFLGKENQTEGDSPIFPLPFRQILEPCLVVPGLWTCD